MLLGLPPQVAKLAHILLLYDLYRKIHRASECSLSPYLSFSNPGLLLIRMDLSNYVLQCMGAPGLFSFCCPIAIATMIALREEKGLTESFIALEDTDIHKSWSGHIPLCRGDGKLSRNLDKLLRVLRDLDIYSWCHILNGVL